VTFTQTSRPFGAPAGDARTVLSVMPARRLRTPKLDVGRTFVAPPRDYRHLRFGYTAMCDGLSRVVAQPVCVLGGVAMKKAPLICEQRIQFNNAVRVVAHDAKGTPVAREASAAPSHELAVHVIPELQWQV
jgi:hypothetical protein